jgi:hypothetical protein
VRSGRPGSREAILRVATTDPDDAVRALEAQGYAVASPGSSWETRVVMTPRATRAGTPKILIVDDAVDMAVACARLLA